MSPLNLRSSASPWSRWLQAYSRELRIWAGRCGTRYAVALGLLIVGAICLAAAMVVGCAALFRWIESLYGLYLAFAVTAGLLVFLGIASLVTAWLFAAKPLPALPRPSHQTGLITGSAAARAMLSSSGSRVLAGDTVTEVLAAVAAVLFVGWIATSRMKRARSGEK
jgi:hypothetical protein